MPSKPLKAKAPRPDPAALPAGEPARPGAEAAAGPHHERLADPAPRLEEGPIEETLRPQRLAEFVGQPQVKSNLGVFLRAARERGWARRRWPTSWPSNWGWRSCTPRAR
jgi:hypothetical protein